MNVIASGFGSLAGILGLAIVAGGIVYYGFRLWRGDPVNISFPMLLTAYFYLLTMVGLIIMLMGLSGLTNTGLSLALGRDFSYSRPPVMKAVPVTPEGFPDRRVLPPEDQQMEQDRQQERQFREGLLQGASMAVVGGIVWAIHFSGRRRVSGVKSEGSGFLLMAYLIIMLVISSITGLIGLTSGVYETLRYFLVQPVNEFDYWSAPGQSVSIAIVFVPVWAYYLVSLLRGLSQRSGGETVELLP